MSSADGAPRGTVGTVAQHSDGMDVDLELSHQPQQAFPAQSTSRTGLTGAMSSRVPVLPVQASRSHLLPAMARGGVPICYLLWPGFDACVGKCLASCIDAFMYILGPILICAVALIHYILINAFFRVLLPMWAPHGSSSLAVWAGHVGLVAFFVVNIMFNYILCVCTANKGKSYDRVVRELAKATGYAYPETPHELMQTKIDCEQLLIERRRQRHMQTTKVMREKSSVLSTNIPAASATTSANGVNGTSLTRQRRQSEGTTSNQQSNHPIYGWMLLKAHEWSFCNRTNQPKPPRSHYDHVTKTLVLNMDHYCPWMFNTIGYFNYRYFCNFLFYVTLSMLYGFCLTWTPFRNMDSDSDSYREQIRLSKERGYTTVQHLIPFVPTPPERTSIAFAFMLSISLGVAVLGLLLFHLYLLLSGQTTIEFHANWPKRRRARQSGRAFINPYDLGMMRNWHQIYGCSRAFPLSLLPSLREPEFLPLPIVGEKGRRRPVKKNEGESLMMNDTTSTLSNDRGALLV